MNKKLYFVLSPYDVTGEIDQKAASYYGQADYEDITDRQDFMNLIKTMMPDKDGSCNTDMLLIGASVLAMSVADSIYVSKNWEQNDYCKVCHAIAFAHGKEMIYET